MKLIHITCPTEIVTKNKTSRAVIRIKAGLLKCQVDYTHEHLDGQVTNKSFTIWRGSSINITHDIDVTFT